MIATNRKITSLRHAMYAMALCIILLLFPSLVVAGSVGVNIPIASKAYDQQNPHTIYLNHPSDPDQGLWFVVWEDWRYYSTRGADIYGQFIDSNGNLCGGEFLVNNPALSGRSNQTAPKAAYRIEDGKIVIVWQDTRPNYVYYNTVTNINFSSCARTVGTETEIEYNNLKEYDYSKLAPTNENIGSGSGTTYSFAKVLGNKPLKPGTILFKADTVIEPDDGMGGCSLSLSGNTCQINYNSGFVSITFAIAPADQITVDVDYSYFTSFPPGKVSMDDELVSRQLPRITYDPTGDQFWVVWKETRSERHRLSELCFGATAGYIADWEFNDSDFIGYVRLKGDTLTENPSPLNVPGADIIRSADTSTVRLLSASGLPLKEIREYESFHSLTNPDVSCDTTSTQCLIVFEGARTKLTLTCECTDMNGNSRCDLADVVTDTLMSVPFDDGFTHIYGIFDDQIKKNMESKKFDMSKYGIDPGAYYPSVAFDHVSKRFLVAWEDMRSLEVRGLVSNEMIMENNRKIWGRMIYSGGNFYGLDFMISYQDTDGDGIIDDNVRYSKQTRPFISYDPVNQRFFVIWQDGRNGSFSLENIDIYGQKVDGEGSLRGSNYAIFTLPSNQFIPTIAYNELTNDFLTVWKDARNASRKSCSFTGGTGTGSRPCGSDVYGQRFSLGNPSLTLLKMDNTPLTPALLSGFENPAGSGGVDVGLFATRSFKVRNTGDDILQLDCINQNLLCNPSGDIEPFSFDGLPSQLRVCDDGQTLDFVPSAELILTVRFTPTEGGSFNRCFTIESDGGSPQVNLSGLSKESDITVSPNTHNFGTVYVGSFKEQAFVVRNAGVATLRISSLNYPGVPFSIVSDGCSGRAIAPGATCNVVVRFTPTTSGGFGSMFGINSNDPDTPTLNVIISGTGIGAEDITVTPLSVNFGNVQVGQNSQQNITIKNDGTAALTILSFSSPLAPFSTVSNNCPISPTNLGVGSSCVVTVRFAPTSIGGVSSSITITSSDPDEGIVTVNLNGNGTNGVPPPPGASNITVSPTSINFGDVRVGRVSSPATVTVTNTGGGDLKISSITYPKLPFRVTSNTCSGTLASSQSCTITVVFNPVSVGYFNVYYLYILSNDPVRPKVGVALSGRGVR